MRILFFFSLGNCSRPRTQTMLLLSGSTHLHPGKKGGAHTTICIELKGFSPQCDSMKDVADQTAVLNVPSKTTPSTCSSSKMIDYFTIIEFSTKGRRVCNNRPKNIKTEPQRWRRSGD